VAVVLCTAPAEAGGHHIHKFHHFAHAKHFYRAHYWPARYQPIVKYSVTPVSYPVTYYDSFGQPYVVWQTIYRSVPTTFYP
jgi:hypothetical protein